MDILKVQEDEKELLIILADKYKHVCPSKNPEKFTYYAKKLSKKLPENIKTQLDHFKSNGHVNGALLIQNLPYKNNIETPKNNKKHIGQTTILARVQAIFNQYLGEMVSYEAEGDGYLFQDMVPNKKLKHTQTSLGSNVELELHTEQAFSDYRPDYLSLACIKGDSCAYTYFLHVSQIVEQLHPSKIHFLQQKNWKIGVDMSFALNGCDFAIRGPMSILNKNEEDCFDLFYEEMDEENNKNDNLIMQKFDLVFDQDLMVGENDEANNLIEEIIDIYFKHRDGHVLQPGEILILNNNKVVHGRSPFQPLFDGNDRFIVRSFILNDLNKIKDKTYGTRMVKCRWS